MIYNQETANVFIQNMINTDCKMDLASFLKNYRTEFYPESNFDFMEKFLEWSLAENKNKFMIPHQMLYEYGITISTDGWVVKRRIKVLELVEGEDFSLHKFVERENRTTGGTTKHQFHFTPYAFKLMLMSATKHDKHEVDVSVYRLHLFFCFKPQ